MPPAEKTALLEGNQWGASVVRFTFSSTDTVTQNSIFITLLSPKVLGAGNTLSMFQVRLESNQDNVGNIFEFYNYIPV